MTYFNNHQDRNSELKRKQWQFSVIFIIAFGVLIARIFYLQIFESQKYLRASENNRIRKTVIRPVRGFIYDRNGILLVDNRPAYDVFVVPHEIAKNDTALKLLAEILGEDKQSLSNKINSTKQGLFSPVRVKSYIDFSTLAKIEENKLDLPGVSVRIEPRRFYPDSIEAPHLLGYVGEVTDEEIKEKIYKNVHLGDLVGKEGVEKYYDQLLRGKTGKRYVEVDALGREIRTLEHEFVEPVPGQNLHLTIDLRLQQFISKKLANRKGAVIVAECNSGEILAMVSKPGYPLKLFSRPISQDEWDEIVNDPEKPLFHRAVQSLYPPGSTYKLVLAVAAVEAGVDPFTKKFYCSGSYTLGGKKFKCWRSAGHGELNLIQAIEQSCNVYFYQLGLEIGIDKWAKAAKQLLFDRPVGIDLKGESFGIVPDREFLNEKYGKNKWPRGLILNAVIGQGDVLVTPIQMLRLALIFANSGSVYPLHLLKYYEDQLSGEQFWQNYHPFEIKNISKNTIRIIRQAMWRVVNGKKGTARSAIVSGVEIAGKTGTAENPHGKPHAWFIGFAPFEKPQIALCIIIEHGGSGGSAAAPLAKQIVKYILKSDLQNAE